MKLQDALFNWLQIHIVAEARPEDLAAKDTEAFFAEVLREDHHLRSFHIESRDEEVLYLHYETNEHEKATLRFDRELAGKLLTDIHSNPKYNL